MQTSQPTIIQSAPSGKQGGVLDVLGTLASVFIPGAAPYVAGVKAVSGIASGNTQQALEGVTSILDNNPKTQKGVSGVQPTQTPTPQQGQQTPVSNQGTNNLTETQKIITPDPVKKYSEYSISEMLPIVMQYPPEAQHNLLNMMGTDYFNKQYDIENTANNELHFY